MRISDWSSDVCSSDLDGGDVRQLAFAALQKLEETVRRVVRTRCADMCAGEKRMIELDLARVCRIRPVGDDAAMAEFPAAVALLVLVEVTTADQHIEKTLVGLHLMHRDQVDPAHGENTPDLQVNRRIGRAACRESRTQY